MFMPFILLIYSVQKNKKRKIHHTLKMCIRDRYYFYYLVFNYLATVSYTHLDVYKRQH